MCRPKDLGGLGFKDLQKFNDAMLAKQIWRLLDYKDTLFHRFFKAKFFPNGSILDAKEGNRSFAWKSILKGRYVIDKGLQWRVGNGASIRIYQDDWLPNPHSRKVISTPDFLGCNAKVSVLIDHNKNSWIDEVVDHIFLPHEASLIKAIPLSIDVCEDNLFWCRNNNGIYSVKSGYSVFLEDEMKDSPSSSDLSLSRKMWRGVWSLRIPNRVKTLLWRAGSDALPTKVNLQKRRILSDASCPGCNFENESSLHALWSCPCLLPIWQPHFGWLIKKAQNCSSLRDLILLCQEKCNSLELFAMTAALIWSRRNQIRVGDASVPIDRISSLAVDNLQEFQRASSLLLWPSPSVSSANWSPPPSGWLKVNFDGASFPSKNLAGLGAIIRNDKGLVMAAFSQPIPLPTSVETVEVLAARSAVCLARDLNLGQVIFEGDAEVIIKAINSGGFSSSSFGHIIRDIKLLSSAFNKVSFSHTRRLGNRIAHGLSCMACNFSSFQVWMEDVPLDLSHVYFSELHE